MKQGLLSKSISYEKLKITPKRIEILTDDEISKILLDIKTLPVVDQVIVKLFLQTGVRRTELCFIHNSNIDLSKNSIYLEHTKTNSARFIYFDDELKDQIVKIKGDDTCYLFSNSKEPFNPSKVDFIFKKMKKKT